jgi:hypothetical protein
VIEKERRSGKDRRKGKIIHLFDDQEDTKLLLEKIVCNEITGDNAVTVGNVSGSNNTSTTNVFF